ncbi:MAG TPA: large-conductance mechanosensitive channel protein MscL [Bacilli bacterium]
MRRFFRDFAAFIQRGNVLDLATGIIIGGAFNTIVKSLVNDILMPLIGLIGGRNISEATLVLVPAKTNAAGEIIENAVTLNYGAFIQSIIDFLIVAFTIFLIIKVATSLHKKWEKIRKKKAEQEKKEDQPKVEDLLIEIRDLLKKDETA